MQRRGERLNNQEILKIAMEQSAIDSNCVAGDFTREENKIVISGKSPFARKYLELPFYCCAWSNLKSARNAIKSGFRPAWVQMTVKTVEFINRLNEKSHSEDC